MIARISDLHRRRRWGASILAGVTLAVTVLTAVVASRVYAHADKVSENSKSRIANSSQSTDLGMSDILKRAGPPARTPVSGLLFSPYKDVTINFNANTGAIQTAITGSTIPIVGSGSLMQTTVLNLRAITLAFATGECGAERWGVTRAYFAADVRTLSDAGVDYVVSTGGQAGTFTCSSHTGMQAFIGRYNSAHLVGIDFDIENGQSADDITHLVNQVAWAERAYPNLRFSFTLATLAASDGSFDGVNALGDRVLRAIDNAHLSHYTVDLMVMDFGAPSAAVCALRGSVCAMGESAIQAVTNLQHTYGTPLNRIELTPMIGANDVSGETFTIDDVDTVVRYAVTNGLAGLHFWSLDRDTPCNIATASPTCNSVPRTTPAQYTKRFLSDLSR